ncbi:MAG: hypothetical protein KFB95_06980 [Simkaniaceae bacterium]|nr:MAG: hypothetical protein KFB95_06980 [Simkaniaceae bacterium]
MKYKGWKTILGDLPDKENPVADVYYQNNHIFQISKEDNTDYTIRFANHPKRAYWEFPYKEATEILQEAKDHLAKLQRTPEEQAEHDAWVEKYKDWEPTPEEQADYERQIEEQRKKYYE